MYPGAKSIAAVPLKGQTLWHTCPTLSRIWVKAGPVSEKRPIPDFQKRFSWVRLDKFKFYVIVTPHLQRL